VDVTDEQLLQLFGPFGSINHVYVVLDNSSRPLAAYISYAEAASATAAMEHFDGKVQLEGAPMELYITPAQDSDCDRMGLPHLEYSRLYYHGFPADSAFQDLLPTFQRFGRVCSLVMSTGVRGTVTMGTKEQAVAVIEGLDNTPVEGGKLRVRF
jgi:RNA recognition motif-containing protein